MNTIWSLPSPKGVWMHTCQAPGRISARESPSDPDAGAAARAVGGEKVRLRIINAGSDTAFRIAIGGHTLTITHTDGFPVEPVEVDGPRSEV